MRGVPSGLIGPCLGPFSVRNGWYQFVRRRPGGAQTRMTTAIVILTAYAILIDLLARGVAGAYQLADDDELGWL
jgi:hypothetical protein